MTPEGRIKNKLDRMLKLYHSVVWYFCPQAGAFGRAGVPDRIVCVDGYFIGIEVKADAKKRPTKLQEKCMADIEKVGGRCFIVNSDETIAAVERFIIDRLISRVSQKLDPKDYPLAGNNKG